jgi:MFS family permease
LTRRPQRILAAGIIGAGEGLAWSGSTAVVHQLAPDNQRSALHAGYFTTAYLGLAAPVLGLGIAQASVGPGRVL